MSHSERFGPMEAELADREGRVLSLSILGTDEPAGIYRRLEGLCVTGGLSAPERVFFFEISVGAAFGLLLEDGSRVVLKAHPAGRNVDFLEASCRVQRHLFERGFPCPRPILDPAPFGEGYATVEAFEDRGELADAHEPWARHEMAGTLARLIQQASEVPDVDGLRLDWTWPEERLWPSPHNALFDFEATTAGAGWIEGVAASAKRVVDASTGPVVVGHGDWSVKHFRFENGEVSVVYDWDSLRLAREAIIVGSAAATFPATWYLPVASLAPRPEEMRLFLEEYQAARGPSFSSAEREAVVAAALYAMAYISRCEHAIDPEGEDLAGGFREALRGREYEYLRLAAGPG
ncbi:MAG: hypothetical protein ACRDTR_12355 [Rubrobacter sp.]